MINVKRRTMLCFIVLLTMFFNKRYADGYKPHAKGCITQDDLVDQLRYLNHIRSDKVAEAMTKVDRKYYLPFNPYEDAVKLIPQIDIIDNPPHMIAFALEYFKDNLEKGKRVLDIGFGSGYMTAIMGYMVGYTGLAVGLDNHEFKASYAKDRVWKDLRLGNIIKNKTDWFRFKTGDLLDGVPEFAPYDVIHVMPAGKEVPETYLDQLNLGGRLLIPIGGVGQIEEFRIYDRDKENGTLYMQVKKGTFFARRSLTIPRNYSELFL